MSHSEPTPTIAPATLRDLPSLAALEREVFGDDSYPAFFLRQAIDLWPHWLLAAHDDQNQLVGYAFAAPSNTPGEAWILAVATAPPKRGIGLGQALLNTMLRALSTDQIKRVKLTVHPENPARRLYTRNGFLTEREDPNYFGPAEPRLLLVRDLE
jgi:[ribosomal protein S18]-alanine N-acetyltransferase